MGNKISELPAAGALAGTELVPVVQGGVTVQTNINAMLAAAGSAGAGAVFITNIEKIVVDDAVTPVGNASPNGGSVATVTSNTAELRVSVEWDRDLTAYQGAVTIEYRDAVDAVIATLPADDNISQTGDTTTARADFPAGVIPDKIVAIFGTIEYVVPVTSDAAPVITTLEFTGPYPGAQTELKEDDAFTIHVVADLAFVSIEIDGSAPFATKAKTQAIAPLLDTTTGVLIADRGDVNTARTARVRVQKASGTFSAWVETDEITMTAVDGQDVVFCNNIAPTIESFEQVDVTYPGGQAALKDLETCTIHSTVTDFDTITYSSPNGDLDIPNVNTYLEDKLLVARAVAGSNYNVSADNYRIVANRAANDNTTARNAVIFIAHAEATLAVTEEGGGRLISSGNDGTLIADGQHEITITANQIMSGGITLLADGGGARGTFIGGGFVTGDGGLTWTRDLEVDDDDEKGTFNWGAITGTNLAGKVTAAITGDGTYELGGFSQRTLTLGAVQNTTVMNVEVVTTGNLNFSWPQDPTVDTFAAIGTPAPLSDNWTISAVGTNPTTVIILDTASTGSSSSPTTIIINEDA